MTYLPKSIEAGTAKNFPAIFLKKKIKSVIQKKKKKKK